MFYKSNIEVQRRRWIPQNTTHVYVDISGSMLDSLPWLAAALSPLHRKRLCHLFAFSTVVDEVKPGRLNKDRIENTYGTDIDCVYEHLLSLPKSKTPRKVVLLTDGYTGTPETELDLALRDRKVQIYLGLVGNSVYNEMGQFAEYTETLPEPSAATQLK